jgi:hypothetical protein
MYVHCSCYMFWPHMCYHKTELIIWGDHCNVQFVLSTLRHVVVVVTVVVVTAIVVSVVLLLLVLLLICFVGYFHPIFLSGRFNVPF